MTIQAILDSAMTDLFNTVGEDATYTPVTGDACACKVWVMKDVEMQPFDFNAQAVERQTILVIAWYPRYRKPRREGQHSWPAQRHIRCSL